ncbi:MAG: hypothetical protein ACOYVK_00865 [Bacillota bacterium]
MDFAVNFTGLTHGEFIHSDVYQQLADGVSYGEITPELMGDISHNIMETFGKICPDVYETLIQDGQYFDNMAMETWYHGSEIVDNNLLYNTDFVYDLGKQYGADAIVGAISHEMGHQMVNQIFYASDNQLSDWQQELCADYIAGISSGLADLSPDSMCDFYSESANEPSESHPNGDLRIEAFTKGYEWASNCLNHTFADFIVPNTTTLKEMLLHDVILPYSDY